MAKKKSLESEAKSSAGKRKHPIPEETVCVDENLPSKVKKKKKNKKKTETEEDVPQIPEVPVDTEDDTKGKKLKKHKETSEPTKKKKKKRKETVETPTDPAVTRAQEEDEEDLTPEERRVLERKMKKILKKEEKDKLKEEKKTTTTEEKVEAAKPIAPQQALEYLTCWAENREQWRFQKTRQTWLLQHMFDAEQIPDASFSVLLTYLEGLQGGARDTTVQKAEALVREQGEGAAAEEEEDGVSKQRTHRAREVVQLLS